MKHARQLLKSPMCDTPWVKEATAGHHPKSCDTTEAVIAVTNQHVGDTMSVMATAARPFGTTTEQVTSVVQSLIEREQQIRELAYQKWEAAGAPPSDGVQFWLEAEEELTGGKPQYLTSDSPMTNIKDK
jgi:hypothetical protein